MPFPPVWQPYTLYMTPSFPCDSPIASFGACAGLFRSTPECVAKLPRHCVAIVQCAVSVEGSSSTGTSSGTAAAVVVVSSHSIGSGLRVIARASTSSMRETGTISSPLLMLSIFKIPYEGRSAMAASPSYIPLYAALATGVLGFVGSWLGAQIGLSSFRRQRAFDKQLDWYERAIRAINELAEAIEIADTFQNEKSTNRETLAGLWSGVQSAHLRIGRIEQEAALFASPKAVQEIFRINEFVQDTADRSEAFDPPKIKASDREEISL